MVTTLCSIVNYSHLKLQQVYEGTCFGHVMLKACQYVTNDEKVTTCLKHVNVKAIEGSLQKTTRWTKKLGKGRQEWEKACVERGLWIWKLKTPMKTRFASKVSMFGKILEFKKAIILCYGQQKTIVLQQMVPKVETWAIAKTLTSILNKVVIACVINQS